jgi:GT2 family glycosyltransferase
MTAQADIAAVVIGRNEGERLVRCLSSLLNQVCRVIYVDSGSTDGSVPTARALGAEVIELEATVPFTAARARNAGLSALVDAGDHPKYVQFVDGDCEVRPDWIGSGREFLAERPDVAVVCGRRRERFPDASIYNRLVDHEWDTPVGEAKACGGDAMIRLDALMKVGGYNPDLIAGEEPELCLRLRRDGWKVWRLDAEMTLHDADMHRFGQWWRRSRRAGHAYAEGAAMYGAAPERHKLRETRSALVWGAIIPSGILLASLVQPWAAILLLVYPAQMVRLRMRGAPWFVAAFQTIGKFPEAQGVLGFHYARAQGRKKAIIEYK